MLPKIIEGLIGVCIGGSREVLLNPMRMGEVEPPHAETRACTPKCLLSPNRLRAGRRYGTQAWFLHMLRRAEPSEAYPTTLV